LYLQLGFKRKVSMEKRGIVDENTPDLLSKAANSTKLAGDAATAPDNHPATKAAEAVTQCGCGRRTLKPGEAGCK